MGVTQQQSRDPVMEFALRPLEEQDIAQSAEIEREAFPTVFPTTSFRRELKNKLASYLVAWRRNDQPGSGAPVDYGLVHEEQSISGRTQDSLVSRFFGGVQGFWRRRSAWRPGQQYITGFLGIWYMPDEAHIVSIGVRQDYRRRGIGELLLIGTIEQAIAREADVLTLEVRESNQAAINLYLRYGFTKRGIRKAYYTDNREDGIILTTDPILTPSFLRRFQEQVTAHERRRGKSERILF